MYCEEAPDDISTCSEEHSGCYFDAVAFDFPFIAVADNHVAQAIDWAIRRACAVDYMQVRAGCFLKRCVHFA